LTSEIAGDTEGKSLELPIGDVTVQPAALNPEARSMGISIHRPQQQLIQIRGSFVHNRLPSQNCQAAGGYLDTEKPFLGRGSAPRQ
jgi:hypothetical protein